MIDRLVRRDETVTREGARLPNVERDRKLTVPTVFQHPPDLRPCTDIFEPADVWQLHADGNTLRERDFLQLTDDG